jgi:beta-lactamase regulating signal transducer with metallopeptidase domain
MLWWFAETTLVAAALATVAALAPRLRPLSPATRHLLWLVVLVKLVTPPLLSWPWPVFTQPVRVSDAPAVMPQGSGEDRQWTEPTAAEMPRATIASRFEAGRPTLGRWAFVAWLSVSSVLAVWQVLRVVRFHRRLREAAPAPAWLVEEAEQLGQRLGVGVPEALAVPGLAVPLLWCLGRPRLLLPSRLIGTMGVVRWRGVLAHELAHLRRGDHWVRQLALVAGWVWWWNPLYWIARRRVDAEAELACDAWVVWALPGDRLVYAETLLDICASLSTATIPSRTPAPALGVTGSCRLFERRLTMILRDRVSCRLTLPGVFGAGLLVLLALPSWTMAERPDGRDHPVVVSDKDLLVGQPALAVDQEVALVGDDADDDDDTDNPAATNKAPLQKKKKVTKPGQTTNEATAPGAGKGKIKIEIDLSDLEKSLGPDSEFVKNLEKLGPEIEKAVEEKFGPGSDFEAKMKELGAKMEKKFGPGSDFEAKMKEFGAKMEKKFGPGSDFEKKLKEKAREDGLDQPSPAAKGKPRTEGRPSPSYPPSPKTGRLTREQRIKDLESRINGLMLELKKLKADDSEDDEEPRARAGLRY